MIQYNDLFLAHQKIQKQKPIILNLTNSVTQDFMANTLLALGASPIMSEDINELEELITISQAININIGTLNTYFTEKALLSARVANNLNTPLILDPVGAGATKSRTNLAINLAPHSNIIRGNASEIIALGSNNHKTAGVESVHATNAGEIIAETIANTYHNTIIISGKTDLVIDQQNKFTNNFGVELMTRVTGMGCVLTSVIAAFAAVEKDPTVASYLALLYYTLCAEKAYQIAKTPAKFKIEFIDSIYQPNWSFIEEKFNQR